ncbi:MAG: septum formation initiator family protein [Lachnospiraceae bacterium]|nr:septum formation initiator family protein [Lachnospiraceae bacterium]
MKFFKNIFKNKKQKKKLTRQNKIQTGIIVLIVCMVLGAVGFNSHRIKVKSQEYAVKEAELEAQIAEAKAEQEALEEQEEYMDTDAYKEEIAREQFGMVKEGEYILKEKASNE